MTENFCGHPFKTVAILFYIKGSNIALVFQKNNLNLFMLFNFQLKSRGTVIELAPILANRRM
jgi:hypothetical protein